MRGILAAVLSTVMISNAAFASFLPPIILGDPFSGSFEIDPLTPIDPSSSSVASSHFLTGGVLTLNLGGGTFSAPITAVISQDYWQLIALTAPGTFNGTELPVLNMALLLPGEGNLTSVLPSSLTIAPDARLTIAAFTPDNTLAMFYVGAFTSFIGNQGVFTFAGILTGGFGTVIGEEQVPGIPEPSTWAMVLIGFAGIGFTTYYRRRTVGAPLAA